MSNTLVDSMPFYTQELCKESHFNYDSFSISGKCSKQEKVIATQDENKQSHESADVLKRTLPRKREGSNILVDCVKRRDNFRNIDCVSNVPCESYDCDYNSALLKLAAETVPISEEKGKNVPDEFDASLSLNMNFSGFSSMTDSGIGSSKSSSPVHDVDASSCLEKDLCENLMDIGTSDTVTIEGENPKSIESSTAEDLHSLHLTDRLDTLSEIETLPTSSSEKEKSPFIQSLFKNVPDMIYFSTKEEPVSVKPEPVMQLLKWKLSTITPVVVKDIVLKAGYTLVDPETTEDWIGTWGKHLKCATFKRIKPFQKVNHYPGAFHLGRKDRLWENYKKMQYKHGEDIFNFFPETYILPADLKALKQVWGSETEKCWILKPCASARGTGVKVIHKWSQVPKNKRFIVQRYISDPYLINGSKFDLRLYVMISSVEPLRVYLFEDGLVRFASQKYSLANKSFANRFIHLTNYSINRKSSSYTSNDDENTCQGHKWSLRSFWSYMSNSGIDVEKIQETITDQIVKTVISTEGPLCRILKAHARHSYNCFELFGFDIMLDKDLHPWLLEVNISPSLHTKTLLDTHVKGPLVKDMLNIAGFEVPKKSSDSTENSILTSSGNRHKPVHNRWLSHEERRKHSLYTYKHSEVKSDILDTLTLDDVHCLMESEDELQRRGSFHRIFPTHDTHKYFVYFDHIRYYNVLLDAWEKTYHADREAGVKYLQDLCDKLEQLDANKTPAQDMKSSEPALTIIEH